ncbi:MAG TPA: hypothetical protein VIR82_03540 [Bradyrhizobium sp.]|jgi:hypothetical protein
MKNYSIVRVGDEYVVQAGDVRILKVASRRQAAKLVTEAAELLGQLPAPDAGEDASLACEGEATQDPAQVS